MLIDLSQPLFSGMPVYPGDPPVTIEQTSRFPKDPWQLTRISLGCHSGTHVDAPRHFLPDGATIEQLPLDRFCGPARLVSLEPIARGLLDANQVTAADAAPGECLLIRTGWRPDSGASLDGCPRFAPGSGRHLAALGIRLLALDLPTVAEEGETEGAMHEALLAAGVVIVENLANVDALAAVLSTALSGRRTAADRRFAFFAVPLLVPGSEASPVRAFADVGVRDAEGFGICNAGWDRV